MAVPARAAGVDSSAGVDTLPPPSFFISVSVADSLTGLPLPGAAVYARSPTANYSIAVTDSEGVAYFTKKDLSTPGFSDLQWITAAYPGYVSRTYSDSSLLRSGPPPYALRIPLVPATPKNSQTFQGTLVDSSRHPIPDFPVDLSIGQVTGGQVGYGDGYMTFTAKTDTAGRFVFTGIPAKYQSGFIFTRHSPRDLVDMISVSFKDTALIVAPRWKQTTSIAAPAARTRMSAPAGPASIMLFDARGRDAAGRRRLR
ncbi:MAG: hypothetical protein JF616_11330 [Fibrobacteres bacterium]|nr:hypothetical protein [Fibrobacterota bacterium]